MAKIRVEVFYKGTVQGVGFRYTAHRMAQRLEVTGYVRNLRDGRVQLVAEGEEEELDRLLDTVDGSLGGYVVDREVQRSVASGEFASFEIRL